MFKVKGTNSDCDTCNHCGKTGLKRVVWLEHVEAGDVQPVGVNCAARLMRIGAARVQTLALNADATIATEARQTVHQVGAVRSLVVWSVVSVGNNGATTEVIELANGLKSEVEKWAEKRHPAKIIDVVKNF